MFTQKRHSRTPVLECLDTRLVLNGSGGIAHVAAQVSILSPASRVALNPQPLPPRIAPGGLNLQVTAADQLNPQPLPPGGGLRFKF
jgi:hypothetical protein